MFDSDFFYNAFQLGYFDRPERWVRFIYGTNSDRGLLRAGQDHDEVGHPAYLLPTPRQVLNTISDLTALNTSYAGITFSKSFTMN